ncbi:MULTISPECIES: L-histidine N(alpha)-methyltransferase [Streptomyces]|uniref:L-histidine N(Alpha)-methyltransferase n=2 Tax=Streptomyces TaxID=1883 RepID=A0ABV9IIX1_9ACTN
MSPFLMTRTTPEYAVRAALRDDVLRGLKASPKWLPPKWFYDAHGSELFERITSGVPEYYPGRTERDILRTRAADIAAATRARTLVELGSGSSEKTHYLLDAMPDLEAYVPLDVSESTLVQAGHTLLAERPGLTVHALIGDFTAGLYLPGTPRPRLIAFLGGTIGNLLPVERAGLLSSLRSLLFPGDGLLLGVDLVKDEDTLIAAYDDRDGVTAAFNKNVLTVINRELDAAFDPDTFDHVAVWDPRQEWIEMRLRSRTRQRVKIAALDLEVAFTAGEDLRTEISAKFRDDGLTRELALSGLKLDRLWKDPDGLYALALATRAEAPEATR